PPVPMCISVVPAPAQLHGHDADLQTHQLSCSHVPDQLLTRCAMDVPHPRQEKGSVGLPSIVVPENALLHFICQVTTRLRGKLTQLDWSPLASGKTVQVCSSDAVDGFLRHSPLQGSLAGLQHPVPVQR